jgi:pimeloyl-ACP methyl ester carboxylesterase
MSGLAQSGAQSAISNRAKRSLSIWLAALAVLLALALAANRVRYDLRSYALLVHFTDPQADGPLLRFESYPVRVDEVSVPTASGRVRGRLYWPVGRAHPSGLLAVHGIHHLGIDEPRLVNFSRAAAESGFAVLTPEVSALADYHVDENSIATIGESAAWLDGLLGGRRVTISGISFAGGLSLLAAREPRYAPHIRALVLMGAYDDLARVSRFLATSKEEFPDGHSAGFPAHDYGASVFVYAHLDQFFSPADQPVAHEALRDWLWEQPEQAQALLGKLSPEGWTMMRALLDRQIAYVSPQILSAIHADQSQLSALSPHEQLADLKLPVFLLHGADDNIIPSAESLWLAEDVPPGDLREVLITSAFSHVDPNGHAGLYEDLRLIHFLGAVLRAAQ